MSYYWLLFFSSVLVTAQPPPMIPPPPIQNPMRDPSLSVFSSLFGVRGFGRRGQPIPPQMSSKPTIEFKINNEFRLS